MINNQKNMAAEPHLLGRRHVASAGGHRRPAPTTAPRRNKRFTDKRLILKVRKAPRAEPSPAWRPTPGAFSPRSGLRPRSPAAIYQIPARRNTKNLPKPRPRRRAEQEVKHSGQIRVRVTHGRSGASTRSRLSPTSLLTGGSDPTQAAPAPAPQPPPAPLPKPKIGLAAAAARPTPQGWKPARFGAFLDWNTTAGPSQNRQSSTAPTAAPSSRQSSGRRHQMAARQ